MALHPDLVDHVRYSPMGKMLHHPLMITLLPYGESQHSEINCAFEQKLQHRNKAIEEQNWHRYIMLHERPYRFETLLWLSRQEFILGSALHWELIGRVWRDSENIHENFNEWKNLWNQSGENRHHAMSEDDRAKFSQLRHRVRIYRGYNILHQKTGREGMSWTISRQKAIWFAFRFHDSSGVVQCGDVMKKDILAFFNDRNEQEVVVNYQNVKNVELITI